MARASRRSRRQPSELDYLRLAELRYQLRRFLRAREIAARAVGIEPQQHLLLLQVKALHGRCPVTIGALAERLQVAHHSAVELVDRLAARRMVIRDRGEGDRREVRVRLRPAGERVLRRLALSSLAVLRHDGPTLLSALRELIGSGGRLPRRRAKGGSS